MMNNSDAHEDTFKQNGYGGNKHVKSDLGPIKQSLTFVQILPPGIQPLSSQDILFPSQNEKDSPWQAKCRGCYVWRALLEASPREGSPGSMGSNRSVPKVRHWRGEGGKSTARAYLGTVMALSFFSTTHRYPLVLDFEVGWLAGAC
ncbi:hypothetical protein AVEN_202076-1 [Araneus ventricosus]|uniref:Uncharacterized protein n=1 Tax=Araneus ventricosus TaxID=182803 RepID=A0A4Y2KXZ7_ARAVE|nr:hypothetical protein AVEN_202076-1 [Araneus ventricosus]